MGAARRRVLALLLAAAAGPAGAAPAPVPPAQLVPSLRASMRRAQRRWGELHWRHHALALRLAEAERQAGFHRAALGRAAEVVRRALDRWGRGSPEARDAWEAYGRALTSSGRFTLARRILGGIVGARRKAQGDWHPDVARAWVALAEVQRRDREGSAARVAAGQAVAVAAKLNPPRLDLEGAALFLRARAIGDGAVAASAAEAFGAAGLPWHEAHAEAFVLRASLEAGGDPGEVAEILPAIRGRLETWLGKGAFPVGEVARWRVEALEAAVAATPYPSSLAAGRAWRAAAEQLLAWANRFLPEQHPEFVALWRLVARAKERFGDAAGAATLRRRAVQLERKWGGDMKPFEHGAWFER